MQSIAKRLLFGAVAGAALLAIPTTARPDDDDWEDALEEREEAWEDYYKQSRRHRGRWNNGFHSPYQTYPGQFHGYGHGHGYGPQPYYRGYGHPHRGWGYGGHRGRWGGGCRQYGGYGWNQQPGFYSRW